MVQSKSRPRSKGDVSWWRAALMKERDREINWILKIQSYRSPFWDMYFYIASKLGEEVCFILALPLASWALSRQLLMHSTILLAMSVGLGNILKNFFLIPRPGRPPVWVYPHVQTDHGLPSTHTMTAITLPWYFLIYCNFLEPLSPLPSYAYGVALLWSVSVIFSRLYNGHHTPLDVLFGAVLAIGILALFVGKLRHVADSFVVSNSVAGVLALVGSCLSILILHPIPPKILTPAHAETGLVSGTMTGTVLALWFSNSHSPQAVYAAYHSLFHLDPSYPLSYTLSNQHQLLVLVLRFVLGVAIVLIARLVVKQLASTLVMQVALMFNKDTKYTSKAAIKWSEAEVVVKYITYIAIGACSVYVNHIAFVFAGLHLPLDDVIISKT